MNRERLFAIRERYLRDSLPVRLGGLAANLYRIASLLNHPGGWRTVDSLLEESKFFIEWIVPDAPLDVQAALVDLQILLAVWHRRWHKVGSDTPRAAHMAQESRVWAERLLDMSGLLADT